MFGLINKGKLLKALTTLEAQYAGDAAKLRQLAGLKVEIELAGFAERGKIAQKLLQIARSDEAAALARTPAVRLAAETASPKPVFLGPYRSTADPVSHLIESSPKAQIFTKDAIAVDRFVVTGDQGLEIALSQKRTGSFHIDVSPTTMKDGLMTRYEDWSGHCQVIDLERMDSYRGDVFKLYAPKGSAESQIFVRWEPGADGGGVLRLAERKYTLKAGQKINIVLPGTKVKTSFIAPGAPRVISTEAVIPKMP